MSRYRRIRIRTATREVVSRRRETSSEVLVLCPECRKLVRWLVLSDAAAVCEISAKDLVREVEKGEIHWRQTSDGQLRICQNSIMRDEDRDH